MYQIYKITNKVNNKIYIGLTTKPLNIRYSEHCSKAKSTNYYLHNAIKKYGKENFVIENIEVCDDSNHMKIQEQYWIQKYRSYDRNIGYNLTLGGEGCLGLKHSDKTKMKISLACRGKNMGASNPIARSISQYKTDGEFIKSFDCIMDAQRETGILSTHIVQVCKDKRKTAGNFIWRYKDKSMSNYLVK